MKRKPVEAWAVVWTSGGVSAVERYYTTKTAAQILGRELLSSSYRHGQSRIHHLTERDPAEARVLRAAKALAKVMWNEDWSVGRPQWSALFKALAAMESRLKRGGK